MKAIEIEGVTRDLQKPLGWDEAVKGPCGSLPIRDEERRYGNAMISEWRPDADELQALCLGGTVLLTIAGTEHPPVALSVKSKVMIPVSVGSDIEDD
jgi:hypothetical protein